MNNKFENFTEKQKIKMQMFKFKAKCAARDGLKWVVDNKELVITVTPVIVAGVTTVAKVANKSINLKKQEDIKNLYCYDRSLGHYWALKRELSNKEWVAIDRRKKNGERLADILSEMKVLK